MDRKQLLRTYLVSTAAIVVTGVAVLGTTFWLRAKVDGLRESINKINYSTIETIASVNHTTFILKSEIVQIALINLRLDNLYYKKNLLSATDLAVKYDAAAGKIRQFGTIEDLSELYAEAYAFFSSIGNADLAQRYFDLNVSVASKPLSSLNASKGQIDK
ncbi:MAG: hypothetical protein Q7S22_00855 [Candidatus Micrarchaeota archaeon]|nr:hypothetical protein [Candidatus Micrarchaeota archaeon]